MIITSAKYFKAPPQKIISLVPSQTELLFSLGLDKEVIGITKFCIHPKEWHKAKTRVGGTKNLNIDLIKKIQPELIIANKEENEKQQIVELAKDFNVWVTDVNNLADALAMIKDIGEISGKANEASTLIIQIKTNFSQLQTYLQDRKAPNSKLQTCYLIWQKPYMTVGGDTFINDMMNRCGLQNIFADKNRYPELTLDQLSIAHCQLLLLSSEPYPFKQNHVEEIQHHLPQIKIILVDGEMFSWYGSRLLLAPQYFKQVINQCKI